jgi:hypothetical protein
MLGHRTIEAEVVYLIRQAGQWPLFQTEIHFHESSEERINGKLSALRWMLGEDWDELYR